ncbi:MAG: LysR family transcriptional regulator, partial [Rhodospirillales bacterium]|nr:LysR family transcriptional regulator [Rhodospirillales bacterium]
MSSASSPRTTEPAARRHPALPTHRQLRTFLAAVETGGISAAARRLGLTQPAASQQVRELERCLGVRLLERVAGRVG